MTDAAAEIQYQGKQTRRMIATVAVAFLGVTLLLAASVAPAGYSIGFAGASAMYASAAWAIAFDGRIRAAWNRIPQVDLKPIERETGGDAA